MAVKPRPLPPSLLLMKLVAGRLPQAPGAEAFCMRLASAQRPASPGARLQPGGVKSADSSTGTATARKAHGI